jgi:hypothetical protein
MQGVEVIGFISHKAPGYAAKGLLELIGEAVTPDRH